MADERPIPVRRRAGIRRRLTRGWVLVVEIATVAAGVATLLAYFYPRPTADAGSAAGPSGGPPAVITSTAPPTNQQTSPVAPVQPGLSLTELVPTEGRHFISKSSSRSQLVLRCPSNNSGDMSRTVGYEVRGQYQRFVARVQVANQRRPPTWTTLEVLADDVRAGLAYVTGSGTKSLSAELTLPNPQGADPVRAKQLSLRIVCQLPGPTITLIDPRLEP
jgi:hypothetical protein